MSDRHNSSVPRHVAIIMDGNGRWAQERGLARRHGHKQGVEVIRRVVKKATDMGISFLTLYAFSTENWVRPATEVAFLMRLLKSYLKTEIAELTKNGVKLQFVGRIGKFSSTIQKLIQQALEHTRQNDKLTLTLALNYGGRQEIVDGIGLVIDDVIEGKLSKEDLSCDRFRDYLYAPDLPDPDLLIRTSGEMRISNFLLWEIAYSEMWITDKYWPDFQETDLLQAVEDYQKRKRRFGGIE